MNTQWNTPPNGDFARYVEQLSARSAVARRASQADGEHELDVGMAPSAEPHGAMPPGTAAARRRMPQREAAQGGSGRAVPFKAIQGVVVAWLLVLAVMFSMEAPLGLILLVLVGGIWIASQMRHRLLPPGANGWRGWAEDLARKAREQQQRQGK
jgi:hypothetical protein